LKNPVTKSLAFPDWVTELFTVKGQKSSFSAFSPLPVSSAYYSTHPPHILRLNEFYKRQGLSMMMKHVHKQKSLYKMTVFLMLYLNLLLTFAVIYILVDIADLGYLQDHYASDAHQEQPLDYLTRSLYFSAITLLSVGYGDVTPFGLARAFAMAEAIIGYLLPAIIVLQLAPSDHRSSP
jgi:potassium channel LctB